MRLLAIVLWYVLPGLLLGAIASVLWPTVKQAWDQIRNESGGAIPRRHLVGFALALLALAIFGEAFADRVGLGAGIVGHVTTVLYIVAAWRYGEKLGDTVHITDRLERLFNGDATPEKVG